MLKFKATGLQQCLRMTASHGKCVIDRKPKSVLQTWGAKEEVLSLVLKPARRKSTWVHCPAGHFFKTPSLHGLDLKGEDPETLEGVGEDLII